MQNEVMLRRIAQKAMESSPYLGRGSCNIVQKGLARCSAGCSVGRSTRSAGRGAHSGRRAAAGRRRGWGGAHGGGLAGVTLAVVAAGGVSGLGRFGGLCGAAVVSDVIEGGARRRGVGILIGSGLQIAGGGFIIIVGRSRGRGAGGRRILICTFSYRRLYIDSQASNSLCCESACAAPEYRQKT